MTQLPVPAPGMPGNQNANVPSKFIDGQGNVNIAALAQGVQHLGGNPMDHVQGGGVFNVNSLAQAYVTLESARQGGVQSPPQLQPGAAPSSAPGSSTSPAPVLQTEVTDTPAKVDWDALTREIQTQGAIQPNTRANLAAAGVPENVIAQHEAGVQAIAENNVRKMADTIGGMENYASFITWANDNMSLQDRQTLFNSMNQPGGHLALQGAFAQFQASPAFAQAGGEPGDINTISAGAGAAQGITPFSSKTERQAAFKDVRYGREPAFTDQVHARARATHDKVQELKLRPAI